MDKHICGGNLFICACDARSPGSQNPQSIFMVATPHTHTHAKREYVCNSLAIQRRQYMMGTTLYAHIRAPHSRHYKGLLPLKRFSGASAQWCIDGGRAQLIVYIIVQMHRTSATRAFKMCVCVCVRRPIWIYIYIYDGIAAAHVASLTPRRVRCIDGATISVRHTCAQKKT